VGGLALFAEALSFFAQSLIKCGGLFETASLHGAAPCIGAGALGVSQSPVSASGGALMGKLCNGKRASARSIFYSVRETFQEWLKRLQSSN
jgi:hypothetical protein